jgi:hypothetical protein
MRHVKRSGRTNLRASPRSLSRWRPRGEGTDSGAVIRSTRAETGSWSGAYCSRRRWRPEGYRLLITSQDLQGTYELPRIHADSWVQEAEGKPQECERLSLRG